MISIFATDIDGVLTDGKAYIIQGRETKSICYRDLDTLSDMCNDGIKIAVITGENNEFTDFIKEKIKPDFFYPACKDKEKALLDLMKSTNVSKGQICYIGDGKYDIGAMKNAGITMCPSDATEKVKCAADIVLDSRGGEGCIAEAYSVLQKQIKDGDEEQIKSRFLQHERAARDILNDASYIEEIKKISDKIVESYQNGGKLLLCGNGGSAADAQHLAAELVSRFYKERQALSAEALNANTSIITAIGNDYEYSRIFARGVEAQGNAGDVLIGISTSGKSQNVIEAFKAAYKLCMITVLFTGKLDESAEILKYTDFSLRVPSADTPRIQEMHILSGHIMCELIENKMMKSEEK
jgi:D-sedoheptulose 7-phosphate isomerase